jgi:hypothetical protein
VVYANCPAARRVEFRFAVGFKRQTDPWRAFRDRNAAFFVGVHPGRGCRLILLGMQRQQIRADFAGRLLPQRVLSGREQASVKVVRKFHNPGVLEVMKCSRRDTLPIMNRHEILAFTVLARSHPGRYTPDQTRDAAQRVCWAVTATLPS